MSAFPGSPRLLRGGLVLIDPETAGVLRIITLQYNPDTLTRSLQIKGLSGEAGDHVEALRLTGPPVETIKLEAEMDAADQLEAGDGQTVQAGLHAELAAIETMVYPTSRHLAAANLQARSGTIEIAPAQTPLPVFVFGTNRIVPVRITELSITEEAFDPALNPIRAKVSLGMRVLSVDDMGFDSAGGGLFMAYLRAKEQLADQVGAGSFAPLGVSALPS